MTILYYHYFTQFLPRDVFEKKIALLSGEQSDRISRLKRPEDAHSSLVGKLLLLKGFEEFAVQSTLKDLKFSLHGKPYIDDRSISFNISHSGNYVVCILSTDTPCIGIDVEEVKPIRLNDFKDIWNDNEWDDIQGGDPRMFYQYWTRKEAVIKAEGRGLSIPLISVKVKNTHAILQDQIYHLQEVDLQPDIVINMASLNKLNAIQVFPVDVF